MTQTNQLATTAPPQFPKSIVHDDSQFANLLDTGKFEHLWRVATLFAKSALVPEHFRGQPENCFITCQMAVRLGVDPFMLMQKTYVVHGKPGMEATIAIALMNSSGLFENAIDYEVDDPAGKGPKDPAYRVRAFAVRKDTKKRVDGPWIDWQTVRAEGWDKKPGSKWPNIPGLMFAYRAAAWFGRLHCPERLMGMQTVDELEDSEVRKFVASEPVQTVQYLQTEDGGMVPTPAAGEKPVGGIGDPESTRKPKKVRAAKEEALPAEPQEEPVAAPAEQTEAEQGNGLEEAPAATTADRVRVKNTLDAALFKAGHRGKVDEQTRFRIIGSILSIDPAKVPEVLKAASLSTCETIITTLSEMSSDELLSFVNG